MHQVGFRRNDPCDGMRTLEATSIVAMRLANGPTLLPTTIASLISALSVGARVSIRSVALFIEAILESLRTATSTGLGITRRALVAAIGSARTMHYMAKGLDWADQYDSGAHEGDMFLSVLDHYTNLGIYVISHVFTLAELFSMSGLTLTSQITSFGMTAAEESVKLLDGFLGSGETSRALSAIIDLVRRELTEDPDFHAISSQGTVATLTALTTALTAFVCLQAATSRRTAREMKLRVIYDCTVVDEGLVQIGHAPQSLRSDYVEPAWTTEKRQLRAPSVETKFPDYRQQQSSNSSAFDRSRAPSAFAVEHGGLKTMAKKEVAELVEELTELCGTISEGENDQLPEEVEAALFELQNGETGNPEARVGSRELDASCQIEISETTTTTTTVVKVQEGNVGAASSPSISNPHGEDEAVTDVDDGEDEWVELADYSKPQNDANPASPAEEEDAVNSRQSSNIQVVLKTITRKVTRRKRSIRRVDAIEDDQSNRGTEDEDEGMNPYAGLLDDSTRRAFVDDGQLLDTTLSRREKGKNVIRALGKALKMTSTSQIASSRSSSPRRTNSSRASSASSSPIVTAPSSPRIEQHTFRTHSRQSSASSLSLNSSRPSSFHSAEPSQASSEEPFSPQRLRRGPSVHSMQSIVTTCKHTSEEPEAHPWATNVPKRPLVESLQLFMRYSSAAYGQAFLRIFGLGKSRGLDFTFPNTQSPANSHAFAHHVGIRVADILLDTYTISLQASFDNDKLSPIVSYVSVDHKLEIVVLSCRGSLGLSDILTDLTCDFETVTIPHAHPQGHYYVHSGMWHSAMQLRRGVVHETIRQALLQYPAYSLVLCGHSLGGGVAALLSILWSCPTELHKQNSYVHGLKGAKTPFVTSIESGLPPGRPIKCYAYGPPCVASPDLQQYSRGLVISTVHNNDVVTTLSIGSLRDLKTMAMNLHEERQNGTTQEIITRVLGLWQRKVTANSDDPPASYGSRATQILSKSVASLYDRSEEERTVSLTVDEIAAGRGQNRALVPGYSDPSLQIAERSDELEVNEWLWAVMRTLRASNVNDKLYPPGDNFVIENYTVFIAAESSPEGFSRREGRRILLREVEDVQQRFAEPVFGKSLLFDHSPSAYEENLDWLAKAVLG